MVYSEGAQLSASRSSALPGNLHLDSSSDPLRPAEAMLGRTPHLLVHGLFYLLLIASAGTFLLLFVPFDQRVSARGILVPTGGNRVVRSTDRAIVRSLHAQLGARVEADSPLLVLDPEDAADEREQAREAAEQADHEYQDHRKIEQSLEKLLAVPGVAAIRERLEGVSLGAASTIAADWSRSCLDWQEASINLLHVDSFPSTDPTTRPGRPSRPSIPGVPEGAAGAVTQEFRLRFQARHLEVEDARTGILMASGEVAIGTKVLELVEKEAIVVEGMAERGLAPKNEVYAQRRTVAEKTGVLEQARLSLERAHRRLASASLQRQQMIDEVWRKEAQAWDALALDSTRLAQALEQQRLLTREKRAIREQRRKDLELAERAAVRRILRSPVSGIVQSCAVGGAGETVDPGTDLIVIAPDGAPLRADLVLTSKEAGRLRAGLQARLIPDAFPLGECLESLRASIQHVVSDTRRSAQGEGGFRVLLEVPESHVRTRSGDHPLVPGMAVTAEILVEPRRLIDFLLEPFHEMRARGRG